MSSTIMHSGLSSGRTHTAQPRQNLLVRVVEAWFNLQAKQRSRHQLGALDARLLRDIGLDRATAIEEARRSIWQ